MSENERNKKSIVKETVQTVMYSYANYLNWPDEQRCELINGQVYLMVPGPSRIHQLVSGEIFRQLANYLLDKKCQVYDAPFDVRLAQRDERDEEIYTVVQPDIVVICDEHKLDKKGCQGAPDLVIEITSPSSAGKDRKIKRDLYEKHGVKEYCLVDYQEKYVEVYLLNSNNEYGKSVVYLEEDKIKLSILPELEINLRLVFRE